jgi:O-antigen/teichoic acid export membrane protein
MRATLFGEPRELPSATRDLYRQTAIARTVGVRGFSILATFVLTAVVSRSLDPHDAGAFFLLYTLLALLATAGRLGTDNLALRLLGGDSRNPRRDIVMLGQIACIASLAVAAACVSPLYLYFQGRVDLASVVLVASCVIAQVMSVLAGSVMRGLQRTASGVFAELGSLPTLAVAAILIVNGWAPHGISLTGVVAAMAIGAWLTASWSIPLAWSCARTQLVDHDDSILALPAFVRRHVPRLLPMMGASLLAYGIVWAPIFMLSLTNNLVDVSFYSVAVRLANLVLLLPSIQVSYLAPEFARRYYGRDAGSLNALAASSVRRAVIVTAIPTVALIVGAPRIVHRVFGPQYSAAAPLVRILCFGALITILLGQVNQLMLLCGLERAALLLTAATVSAWLALGWWISAHFGAMGISYLAATMSVIYAACGAIALKRMKGIRSYFTLARSPRDPMDPTSTELMHRK